MANETIYSYFYRFLEDKRGIETQIWVIVLSMILLLLIVAIIFPAYEQWQDTMDQGRAISETRDIVYAIENVYYMGDIGTTESVHVTLPGEYRIAVELESLVLKKDETEIREYPLNVTLVYRGTKNITGPGNYDLIIIRWIANDTTNAGKDYLIEVI